MRWGNERTPIQPKDEVKSGWKDIETYHALYPNVGVCMLRYYGRLHATACHSILLDSLQPMARQSPKTEQARQENFGIVVVDMAHCNHEGSQTETV